MTNNQRFIVERGLTYESTAEILGMSVPELLDAITEDNRALHEIEDGYYKVEYPRVQAELQDWIHDIPGGEEFRKNHLISEIRRVRTLFYDECRAWALEPDKRMSYWRTRYLQGIEDYLLRLRNEVRMFLKKGGGLEISRAKEIPIAEIIKVNSAGFALCPFHKEDTASMKVYKDNHFHCFGCGKGGDVITLAQEVFHLSFVDAVKKLQ